MEQLKKPKVLAHRGFSSQAPENTLLAFERALAVGAHGVELDVTLSADGVPVVVHDDTLDRTSNGTGWVWEHSLAELKALDAGSWFDPRFAGEQIPTLAEALALVLPRGIVNVEIKGGKRAPRGLVRAVWSVLCEHGNPERILVSSFDPFILWRLKRLDPHWKTALLFGHKSGVRRSWPLWRWFLGADFVHPDLTLAKQVMARGVSPQHLNVWTVDEPRNLLEMARHGVGGVITNRPDLAVETFATPGVGS